MSSVRSDSVGPVGARKDAVARYRENIDAMLTDAYPSMIDSAALDELIEADLPDATAAAG